MNNSINSLNGTQEYEADKLATEILMPAEVIKQLVSKDQYITSDIIADISTKLKVSKSALTIRLIDLKYKIPYLTFY